MSQIHLVPAISAGHVLDLAATTAGVIHSVFSRAVNLEMDRNLWTLLAASQTDLPFGIRTSASNFDAYGLRKGNAVSVRSGFLGVKTAGARLVVDCRSASRWSPLREERRQSGIRHRLALVASAAHDRSWHGSAGMAQGLISALENREALGEVLAQVVGCGPGLTPAGDDVLVGALAVLTSPYSGAAGAEAAGSIRRLIHPLTKTTTEVSGHLLRQAADGLFGRSVHELISALISDSPPQQLRDTVSRVIETGATSGADTCEGLLAFAPSFLIPQQERAAA